MFVICGFDGLGSHGNDILKRMGYILMHTRFAGRHLLDGSVNITNNLLSMAERMNSRLIIARSL